MQDEIQNRLEKEFQRFIELSNLLDRKTRKYLVQYMQNKLEPNKYRIPEELNDRYYDYFTRALDELFSIQHLLNLCQEHEKLSAQIMLDTLQWLRKSYQKVREKGPHDEEVDYLENWGITPMHRFVERWHVLITYLNHRYTREDLNTDFYSDRFKDLIQNRKLADIPEENQERLELLLHDLLAQWDALLNAKLLEYQLKKLEDEIENMIGLMEAKVNEFVQLQSIISPFSDYLSGHWDMSRSLWQDSSFDTIQQYDDLLQREKELQELADMLGQMREAELEIEEETFEKTIIRQEWVADEMMRTELVDVHNSDDLNHMLSSEAALLGEETEDLFLKKWVDKQLLSFRYEDRKLVKSEDTFTEVYQRTRLKEKGPFIICVDTSESMHGRPEQIAKVLCLGILKMASRENRRAYLINFSTGIQTLDLQDIGKSIDAIAKFLRMSFYGGTDISLPLFEAIKQLKTNNYRDADVLVISDFIMYKIHESILTEVKYFQQNQDTQFHSLTLSKQANPDILKFFDTNWVYNPKEKGIIRELTKGLRTIG
jgi:uncharacterized protein with von Willebrand factor type A (vWA) domain